MLIKYTFSIILSLRNILFLILRHSMLLILDLDETLIHATNKLIREDFDFQVFDYFVYKRPYLDEFINHCAKSFTLAVWSSASDDYVQGVVAHIFPKNIPLAFVWGRSRCTPISTAQMDEMGYYHLDSYSHYGYAKMIRKVKKQGFNLAKTLIVDDTPAKVANSYGNAIYAKPYTAEKEDTELLQLAGYLDTIKDAENVRTIEKRFWRHRL